MDLQLPENLRQLHLVQRKVVMIPSAKAGVSGTASGSILLKIGSVLRIHTTSTTSPGFVA